LRKSIPAARALPLLAALAKGGQHQVVLEYLEDLQMQLDVSA